MPNQPHSLSPSAPAHRRIDYYSELNPAQYQAVTATDGPILVIAGAGSGKTRTLVYRLAYLVDQGVNPEHILLLTFTRKAAREMLGRAADLLQRPLTQVLGGPFHSVCFHWLRHWGVCRTAKDIVLSEAEDEFTAQELGPRPGQLIALPEVAFTRARYGPVQVVAWWAKGEAHPIFLVTNLELAQEACWWYKKRFRIETFFSDFRKVAASICIKVISLILTGWQP